MRASVVLVASAALACAPAAAPRWVDQLEADSPCYDVNLLDGLDETGPDEVLDAFACLDHGAHLAPLRVTAEALRLPDRGGDPAAVDVARAANALPGAGIDVFALAGVAVDALAADPALADGILDLFLEAAHGRAAADFRSGRASPDSPSSLARGPLSRSEPVVAAAAAATLDADLAPVGVARDLLASAEAKQWVRSVAALAGDTRPEVAIPMEALLPDLGDAIEAVADTRNDVWPGATGNSLRDAARAALDADLATRLARPVSALLEDDRARANLAAVLAADAGRLRRVPEELAWLASVDVDGGSLGRGEVSGLHAFLRLLAATNQPMRCSLDVGITTLDVDIDNLAVAILEVMSEQDPDNLRGGVGILGEVLDWGLSDALLRIAARTGVCSALTEQVVDDLAAVDLVASDRAADLVAVLVGALAAARDGNRDRIPEIADAVETLVDLRQVEPLQELVRDVGPTAFAADAADLAVVLSRPGRYGLEADLDDALALVPAALDAWPRLDPVARAVAEEDATWDVVDATGALLRDPAATSRGALGLLPPLVEVDPDLVLLDQIGAALGDEDVAGPLLRVADTEPVRRAAMTPYPVGDEPSPLGWACTLVVDGTVDDVLRLVRLVLDGLR